jgi:hypothetical protein
MEILSDERQMMIVSDACHNLRMQTENLRATYPPIAVSFGAKLTKDGDQWCFLYGDNLQDGVAGFGETPAIAAENFERIWFRGE